jgi:glycosyltransferase involved in cell wall biosynthesis
VVVIPPFSFAFSGATVPPVLDSFFATHAPVITSVGFYEPAYGFDDVVRLLGRVRQVYPNAGLVLVGDRTNSAWCEALIREQGLSDHVALAGNLGHDECLAVMQRSAVFVRATHYDGDSLSVREALSLGLPVVATATDFRPEGVIGYPRGSFEDLAGKTIAALGVARRGEDRPAADREHLARIREVYLTMQGAR